MSEQRRSFLKLFDPDDVKPGESLSWVVHRCDICGRRFRWNAESQWYGPYDPDDGPIVVSCGCRIPGVKECGEILKLKRG